ncbi:metal/formaldehyde-sensitive transcriptional repressor [Nitrobacter sp.]|uniref:metal/formaldehyde-sensitive transcriptional repressor n=1 Tax=Nitrobacter sp. TaxID=29420 RepID=UPI0029CAB6FE|nr:metal/formaldehyde-sensitive transcriptional repressor [Nitrobacter sp.]
MSHLQDNEALVKRVRRIAGQVAAIERALVEGEDCATTLHRAAAARGAMNGLMDQIIEAHMEAHVAGPGLSDAERTQGARELIAAIRRYAK